MTDLLALTPYQQFIALLELAAPGLCILAMAWGAWWSERSVRRD